MDADTVKGMTALTQIRQQLEQAREELKHECAVLQAQLSDKAARLDALNVLLANEAPTVAFGLVPFSAEEKVDDENLTSKAKEVMKAAGKAGVKPRDLTRKLKQQGVDVKSTFASNFLWRMKNKTHEVVAIGDRHYWKGFEPEGADLEF
jgi:small-conductance mechanosensitive channel